MPGVLHEVTDMYLDDILPMLQYQPAQSKNARRPKIKPSQASPPAWLKVALDAAIENAFLQGRDQDFEQLLEVEAWHYDSPAFMACLLVRFSL